MELNEVKQMVDTYHTAGKSRENTVAIVSAMPINGEAAEAFEYIDLKYTQTGAQDPAVFNLTDAGNAEYFISLYGDILRYDHQRARWLRWNKHFWKPDTDKGITRLAVKSTRERYLNAVNIPDLDFRKKVGKWCIGSEQKSRAEALLSFAKDFKPIADSGEQWDRDPWLFCVENGVIDLRTGELRDGKPQDRITQASPVKFDAAAECPRWRQFQIEIHAGDAELIAWKRRYLGYSLTGDTREQIFPIRYGQGENGKGVEDGVIRYIMGDYSYDAPFATFELNQRAAIPNDMAALVGRRFVTSSETNEGARLNEARIKQLTGQDPVTARFLHAEYFTFQPVLKLWLAVNHRPVVRDDSHGFWRRVCLVPYEQTFIGERRDNNLDAKLKAEASGILNWMIAGCLEWQQRGLSDRPVSISEATESYRKDSDDLGDFISTLQHQPQAEISGKQLYGLYRSWAIDQGLQEREIFTNTKFGRVMGQKFSKFHKKGGTYYRGVTHGVTGLVTGFEATQKSSVLIPYENSHVERYTENPSQSITESTNPSPSRVTGLNPPVTNPSPTQKLPTDDLPAYPDEDNCPVCTEPLILNSDCTGYVCPKGHGGGVE